MILVDEIQDQETLSTALEAAQTGHLVLGTLYTNSALKIVERVLGVYPPGKQESVRRSLSASLLDLLEADRIDGHQAVAAFSLKPNELAQALQGQS